MSSYKYLRTAPEKDVLQMNMETISKELSDLMITCEKEFGATQHGHKCNIASSGIAKISATHSAKVDESQNITKLSCQEKDRENEYSPVSEIVRSKHTPGERIAKQNLNLMHSQHTQLKDNAATMNPIGTTYPLVYPGSGVGYMLNADLSHSNIAPTYMSTQYVSLPKYEFHYLRPQRDTGKVTSAPLISITAQDVSGGRHYTGSYKKYPKSHTKLNFKDQSGGLDYNNIIVDLSVLGIPKDGKISNPVLRLFALFRDLHNAIAEVPPSLEPSFYSAYEPTFAPLPKAVIPCTMNVQCQVKHASCQVVSFLCTMQRLVAINVMYDQSLAAECELYLFKLRQILAQFEMYKFMELEHKRGQFISEGVRGAFAQKRCVAAPHTTTTLVKPCSNHPNRVFCVQLTDSVSQSVNFYLQKHTKYWKGEERRVQNAIHAAHLEKLLEQINQQIREVHLRVIAFDWYIGNKYRRETGLKMVESVNRCSSPTMRRSKIGVINEILEQCDAAMSTIATSIGTTTVTNTTKTTSNVTSNKRNNDEFSSTSAAAAGMTAATCLHKSSETTYNAHMRQPVFYIG